MRDSTVAQFFKIVNFRKMEWGVATYGRRLEERGEVSRVCQEDPTESLNPESKKSTMRSAFQERPLAVVSSSRAGIQIRRHTNSMLA